MIDKEEKENLEFKDDFIKDFVGKGNRKISNKNFESQIMQRIYSTTEHKKAVNSKLKWSIYSFYFGILLIGSYALITIIGKSWLTTTTNLTAIVMLFFSIVFGVVLVGNFKRPLQSFSI